MNSKGECTDQVDLLVLSPMYPEKLLSKKEGSVLTKCSAILPPRLISAGGHRGSEEFPGTCRATERTHNIFFRAGLSGLINQPAMRRPKKGNKTNQVMRQSLLLSSSRAE